MKSTLLLWLLIIGLANLCSAQSPSKGKFKIDTRLSLGVRKALHTGLGLEYTLLESPKWETGLRIGGLLKKNKIRSNERDLITWWVSSDLSLYRQLSKNTHFIMGTGASIGTKVSRGSLPTGTEYFTKETIFLYLIFGFRSYIKEGPFFMQLQLKTAPLPDRDILRLSLLELSFGVRLGRTTQP